MDQKRLKIARHETGHAVMALRYRQPIEKISLQGMDSPTGTEEYQAFMKLEKVDPNLKFTGEKAIQKIMVALSGYASEVLFYDGLITSMGGDDLRIATKNTENMLQFDEFRSWVATLPVPEPSALDMIENPLVRAYIHLKIGECVEVLKQVSPAIQLIAEELYKKGELTGDQVSTLFSSFMTSIPGNNHTTHG